MFISEWAGCIFLKTALNLTIEYCKLLKQIDSLYITTRMRPGFKPTT